MTAMYDTCSTTDTYATSTTENESRTVPEGSTYEEQAAALSAADVTVEESKAPQEDIDEMMKSLGEVQMLLGLTGDALQLAGEADKALALTSFAGELMVIGRGISGLATVLTVLQGANAIQTAYAAGDGPAVFDEVVNLSVHLAMSSHPYSSVIDGVLSLAFGDDWPSRLYHTRDAAKLERVAAAVESQRIYDSHPHESSYPK